MANIMDFQYQHNNIEYDHWLPKSTNLSPKPDNNYQHHKLYHVPYNNIVCFYAK
mgnify:CR=1 FL=1